MNDELLDDDLGDAGPSLPAQPYPGLRPFTRDEWTIFFGREQMIQDVVDRVVEKQFVAVHGDSGCGKSSLIAAGVMPFLEHDQARAGGRWTTTIMRPEENPLGNLARALAGAGAGDPARVLAIRRILNRGVEAPAAVAAHLGCSDTNNICVLFDQFEELFEHARRGGGSEAALVADFLVGLVTQKPKGLHAILTMRSDYLGQCAHYRGFAEAVNETQYLVPRMERPALLRAIREPAELFGGFVDLELASRLIADAGAGQDQLPLIQHGLMLMWRRKAGDKGAARLTLDDYRSDGDLAAQLSRHADSIMQDAVAGPADERVVETLFRALTDRNPEGLAIRRRQNFASLMAQTGASRETLARIIDRFRAPDASFLRPYGEAPLEDDDVIDISHEAFIRNWKKIAEPGTGWLDREAEDGLIWTSLRIAAATFEKNPEARLSHAAVVERQRWLANHNPAWAERYGNQWDAVERLISTSAAEANRTARRRRIIFYTSVGAAAAFALLAVFAGWQTREAKRFAADAKQFAADANAQRLEADRQRVEAEKQKAAADKQAAEAQRLAVEAQNYAKEADAQRAEAEKQKAAADKQAAEAQRLAIEAQNYANDAESQRAEAEKQKADAEAQREEARKQAAEAEKQRAAAEALAVEAKMNGTASLSSLARIALLDNLPSDAVKLALASWPRGGDELRPRLKRSLESLRFALPALTERLRVATPDQEIRSAAFSRDGRSFVTGSADGVARVWDAATGVLKLSLTGHTNRITSVAYSPDGARIATASWDNTVRIWDATTGAQLQMFTESDGWYTSVAFSPEGKRIVTASGNKTAQIWDLLTGRSLAVLTGHDGALWQAVFSPDGKRVLTASEDKTAKVWDSASGTVLMTLAGHDGPVCSAVYSRDGTMIATGSTDKKAILWDAASGDQIRSFTGHDSSVWSVEISPDNQRLATASYDRTARIWNIADGTQKTTLIGHAGAIYTAFFSPDNQRVLTASTDATARIWDVAAPAPENTLDNDGRAMKWAEFSPDGKRIIAASTDRIVHIWDLGVPDATNYSNPHGAPNGRPFTDAETLAYQHVWPAESSPGLDLVGHTDTIWSASFSPDGSRVATGSSDNTAIVWDAVTGKIISRFKQHTDRVNMATFSPDGKTVATAARDNMAYIWNADTAEILVKLQGHSDKVNSVRFSPDGSTIATSSSDKTVRIWDVASGETTQVLQGHEDEVWMASYSHDGKRLVTASADKTARVWDVATGRELMVLRGHTRAVGTAMFSPDDSHIITSSDDGTARIWDASTGAEIRSISGHKAELWSAAFSPDGRFVVTASTDGTAKIWNVSDLEKGDGFAIACERLGNNLDLTDTEKQYGLPTQPPICGDHKPLPVDYELLQ